MPFLQFAFLAVCVTIGVFVYYRRVAAKFDESWPPIDDDEFIRRCSPGVDRDTAIRVRRIVSEQLGIEYERIYPEQSFYKDLDAE